MLLETEVFKVIKPVNVGPLVQVAHKLEFVDSKGECAWVTKPGSVAPPELLSLVNGLHVGGEIKRMFCRRLAPHQGIPVHVDDWIPAELAWRRFQLPILSHPDIVMRWPDDNVELHLAPGFLYEVRFDRLHEVVNPTPFERIHIQLDVVDCTL